jgi:excisionase family DNA binding protein
MLLTIKELSAWLNIKPSTLYLWASQGKIPCRRIHGLIRFEREAIQAWLNAGDAAPSSPLPCLRRPSDKSVDDLVEAAKRALYTAGHGETGPTSSLIRKEDE